MNKLTLSIFVLLLMGMPSCSTVKTSSKSKKVTNSATDSDKTVINYERTLSPSQAKQVTQLLREKLEGFPDQELPIKFVNNTKNAHLDLSLKKRKVKFSFRSKLDLHEDNQEVVVMQQLKESIDAL